MTFSANANFHGAIEEGAIRHVEKYLNVGEDVNAQGREGRAALHCAVLAISKLINDNHYESRRYELFRIAELLIVKGADVNAKDNEGRTPLDYTESIPPSGRQYPAEIADLLRKQGGKSGAGGSIIFAAGVGNIEAVKQTLANGADMNAKGVGGGTPLHVAAVGGHKEIVELLITAGADANAKGDVGFTPLHQAAINGHKEIAELLIAKGADVNAKGDRGVTPFHIAANGGHKEIVELLIAKGADVNAKNDIGSTPLHGAILEGQNGIVELLIAKGANVNAQDDDGQTPLDRFWYGAAMYGTESVKKEVFDLILKQGAKTGKELKAEGK